MSESVESGQPVDCGCWRCLEQRGVRIRWMVLCATCGNKRCPRAADHTLACTGSNAPGQVGSAYEHGSGAASVRRMSAAPPTPCATCTDPAELTDCRSDTGEQCGPCHIADCAECQDAMADEDAASARTDGRAP